MPLIYNADITFLPSDAFNPSLMIMMVMMMMISVICELDAGTLDEVRREREVRLAAQRARRSLHQQRALALLVAQAVARTHLYKL